VTLSNAADFLLEGLDVSSSEHGLSVINISNSLDIPAIVPFKAAIDKCIEDGNIFIVVNLENVKFMDSPFVGTLMGCRKMLQKRGGDLAICSLSQFLQDRLSVMGLNRIFHFYSTSESAIADFHFLGSIENFSFTLPLHRSCVTLLRKFVCAILVKKNFKSKMIFRIETILDELVNNAVDYSNPESKSFFASVSLSRKKIVLIVKNMHNKLEKASIDELFNKYQNPKIDDESARGRGITLIKMLSNSVNLDVSQTEVIVQATKIVEV
jgi:anti-anti-sigma factor